MAQPKTYCELLSLIPCTQSAEFSYCFDSVLGKIVVMSGANSLYRKTDLLINAKCEIVPPINDCYNTTGIFVSAIAPCEMRDNSLSEQFAARNCSILLTLAGIHFGKRIFSNPGSVSYPEVLEDGTSKTNHYFKPVENPTKIPLKNLDESGLSNFQNVLNKFSGLEAKIRTKLELSLHWYYMGLKALGDPFLGELDSFLKLWIGFETVAMDTPSVLSSLKTLQNTFESTDSKIHQKLLLGKIVGLRSKIVHDGFISPANLTQLCEFMEKLLITIYRKYLYETQEQDALAQMINLSSQVEAAYFSKTN